MLQQIHRSLSRGWFARTPVVAAAHKPISTGGIRLRRQRNALPQDIAEAAIHGNTEALLQALEKKRGDSISS